MILSVFLLFFGAKKIPDLARGLGSGIREFKDAAASAATSLTTTTTTEPEVKEPQA